MRLAACVAGWLLKVGSAR